MRSLFPRPRIHAGGDERPAAARQASARAGIDYARLMRRARRTPHADGAAPSADEETPDLAQPHGSPANAPRPPAAHPEVRSAATDPESACLPSGCMESLCAKSDYVQAMARHQAQGTALCAAVTLQVAGFCADPAVASRGGWMLRIKLDPTLLPACTLQMDLSFLRLALRFETGDAGTRELVLRHADTLRCSLAALLMRHSIARDLEIVVW